MNARIWLFLLALASLRADTKTPSAESIAMGKRLFAASCSVGYCHGAEGRAGRGPRLRDREWDRNYLFKVIDGGIPNSSMPGWHGRLSSEQITSIIAYILSISKDVTESGAPAPAPDRAPESRQTSSGSEGNAIAGKSLFFDLTNERNCGVCHKAGGSGGEVGVDLDKIAAQPARVILRRILVAPAASGQMVEIVMKDGETLQGVIAEEKGSRLRVYDLTSPGPPVARTFDAAQVAQRRSLDPNLAHDRFAETYTVRQLLDIIAYLKSVAGAGKVQIQDLF